jgi:hypothetical protein
MAERESFSASPPASPSASSSAAENTENLEAEVQEINNLSDGEEDLHVRKGFNFELDWSQREEADPFLDEDDDDETLEVAARVFCFRARKLTRQIHSKMAESLATNFIPSDTLIQDLETLHSDYLEMPKLYSKINPRELPRFLAYDIYMAKKNLQRDYRRLYKKWRLHHLFFKGFLTYNAFYF